MAVQNANMESIQEIVASRREDLHKHAKTYQELFSGKKVTYYFYSKGVPKRRTICFYRRNFMHLCGVHRYEGGWKKFYKDCIKGRIKTGTAFSLRKAYVEAKIDALAGLPKLLEQGYVGFSDDAVVHKGTNYGEMVRTQEDMIALGTIEDEVTKNQVPISLINIEVSTQDMKKATSNWSKVSMIKVESLESKEFGLYEVERERDEEMREKMKQVERARKAKSKRPKGSNTKEPTVVNAKQVPVKQQAKKPNQQKTGSQQQQVTGKLNTEPGDTLKRNKRKRRRRPRGKKEAQYQNKDRVQEVVK